MADIYLQKNEVPEDTAQSINNFIDTMVTDDELLLRCTFQKDPKMGCELLFRRYYMNLCNHAIRFVHSKEIAEDIVSDVFASFWQNKVYEQVTVSYRAYLYKSIRHRSYNYLKWQLSRTRLLEPTDQYISSEIDSPEELLQFSELHQKIETIVQQLPPQCRRAYLLKKVEGKKYSEVALEMKITQKAVEALVSRGLSRLRNELKDDWFILFLIIFYPLSL